VKSSNRQKFESEIKADFSKCSRVVASWSGQAAEELASAVENELRKQERELLKKLDDVWPQETYK
jgi:hypothetical protein